MPAERDFDILLGRLLTRRGIISADQRDAALARQRDLAEAGQPQPLGLVVADMGAAAESEIVAAINDHFGLGVTRLTENIASQIHTRRVGLTESLPSPRTPIWLKLTLATALLILLTVAALGYVTMSRQTAQLYDQTVRIGTVSLNYFANNSRVPMLDEDMLILNSLIREATEVEGIRYAIIVDSRRIIMAHTDRNRLGTEFIGFNTGQPVMEKGPVRYFSYLDAQGSELLNLSRAITFKDRFLGEVHVGVSVDFINALIRERTLSILLVAAIILLVAILVSVWLGFRFSRPIRVLAEATAQISRGNYQHKVDLDRNDELGSLAVAFNRMSRELWKTSLMQKTFGKYVGSDVLEMIMANPESDWLKGQRREVTVLFTDIRGFTAFSEGNEPERVVEHLNQYLEITSRAIIDRGGYVDKFIGDAVLGVFGMPAHRDDHVERAVRAAGDIQRLLAEAAAAHGVGLLAQVGIGLNTGVAVVGNIGSQSKMEYTVIGDTVNVASRVNGVAGAGEIILTAPVRDRLPADCHVSELAPRKMKGKSAPMRLFRLEPPPVSAASCAARPAPVSAAS